MPDVMSIDQVQQLTSSIGNQISTAVNLGKERSERVAADAAMSSVNNKILVNWYFPNAVIHRLLDTDVPIDTPDYFIDMWKLVSGSVIIQKDVGIVLDGVIQQTVENSIGPNFTATVLTTEGLLPQEDVEYDDDSRIFQITAHGETLIAAKLEIGDQQTLAAQDDSGRWYMLDVVDMALEIRRVERWVQSFTLFDHVITPFSATSSAVKYRIDIPMKSAMKSDAHRVGTNTLYFATQRNATGTSKTTLIDNYTLVAYKNGNNMTIIISLPATTTWGALGDKTIALSTLSGKSLTILGIITYSCEP